jgi:CHAD domain-containing protein
MPSVDLDELAFGVLGQQGARFLDHARQIGPSSDPEHVHQARVATRRMRAALRVFDDILGRQIGSLGDELKWMAALLGAVRDQDVQLQRFGEIAARLEAQSDCAPYSAWMQERRQHALGLLLEAIASQRFVNLARALENIEPVSDGDLVAAPETRGARGRIERAFRKLRQASKHLNEDSEASDLHKARIRAKRFRYTVEFMAPLCGKAAGRVIDRTTRLQDLLGNHQDGIVSVRLIEEAIHTVAGGWPVETALALGRVVQWEADNGYQLRREVPRAYRAVRAAWRRLRRDL